jgi:phosphoribosylaminoimidazole-succinocarboxamide synthase
MAAKAKANQIVRKGNQLGTSCQNSDKLNIIDTKKEIGKIAGVIILNR